MKIKSISIRQLAQELKLSPSHISRVIRGVRVSARLATELKKRGIKCRKAI
ncbi:MAG: helix-turn-helix domain-containing protein [Kiritimatiellae bacterium]|nr:helix-turn-helix domain-containing protein [Kiritimatiellia bacterium]